MWVARHNGPDNEADNVCGLVVNNLGNVYITGSSVGIGAGSDYVTIKYDTLGNELWVARYNGGQGWYMDIVTAISIDKLGNIYVTGHDNDEWSPFYYVMM